MTSLKDFYRMLTNHDWYHMMSDDHSVWLRGCASEKRLAIIAKESEEHAKLMRGFSEHYFSGKSWGTVQTPLPEEPA